MPHRARQIIETAITLAEKGGFEAVRLRDVAAESGVGLGTLYTRFKSKEDILLAAVELEIEKLVQVMEAVGAPGDTPLDRVMYFFTLTTRQLLLRPNFAKAVLRALGGGEPKTAGKVINFHSLVTRMVTAALRGVRPSELAPPAQIPPDEERVGFLMQQIWYATLVGWNVGSRDEASLLDHMREAASLLLDGLNYRAAQ